ncbi:UNVERIFIED_CONTAM: hypothetical protein Slati_3914600 [Sesamum latifolium]|uniref:Integrase catalytic domain-containing protein n=1 Tax=Sesamum latifolium TaxID=2727402 RepID=A0AAW2TMN0_9LAMI
MVGEASTSKAKSKGARRWKRKKGKGTAVTTTASTGGAPPAARGKGQGKVGVLSDRRQMMCACIAKGRGIGRGRSITYLQPRAHICNDLQVLERSRKLSKDEMILRLDDGKAVTAEAVGFLSLVVQGYRLEVENQTNRKIKALWLDRGGEYLSAEFIDYLKENGILSQWTPPGTPQLNGVAERRNRTLLDMVHDEFGTAPVLLGLRT